MTKPTCDAIALYTAPQPASRQEAQEPWGYARKMPGCGWGFCSKRQYEEAVADCDETKKLYATPQPAPAPLTDEQIRDMCKDSWVFETVKQWVRIVEQLHGIKGGKV